jgi:hypothetical protein
MRLSFIQLSGFAANWRRMKFTDEDLRALENAVAQRPDGPPVMSGTGGLRKIRFAPRSAGSGKSGGARACYAYFPEFGLVYFCAVYAKNDRASLSAAERGAFRRVLQSYQEYLRENAGRGRTP